MPTFHFVELVLSLDYFSSLDSAAYAASSDGDADNGLSSLPGGFDKSFLSKPVWGTEHEQKVKKTPLSYSIFCTTSSRETNDRCLQSAGPRYINYLENPLV